MTKSVFLSLAAAVSITAAGVVGCASSGGSGHQTISFYSTATEDTAMASYRAVIAKFEKQYPDITVDVTFPGAQYESVLQTMLAGRDLPDVFDTDGWTLERFGSYLLDLSKMPWASEVSDAMKPLVTDDAGHLLALPITQNRAGVNVNMDVLNKYHLSVPSTWGEFIADAETIRKDSNGSITPVVMGGADGWPVGTFLDWMAIPDYISPQQNDASALKNGTFDFSQWSVVAGQLKQLQDDGLLNSDVITAKYADTAETMAQGQAAFAFYGQGVMPELQELNPKENWRMMPIPAVVPGDSPTWSGGEGQAIGISKSSSHISADETFVNFLAEPANVKALIGSEPIQSGMKDVNIDVSAAYTTNDPKIRVFEAFDREYFPNGMYDIMSETGQELLAGSLTPATASQQIESNYDRLKGAS